MSDLVEVLRDAILGEAICVENGIANGEEIARACLAALESAGYRVVPVEPTQEMLIAAREAANQSYIPNGSWAWEIMLAAAPKVTE